MTGLNPPGHRRPAAAAAPAPAALPLAEGPLDHAVTWQRGRPRPPSSSAAGREGGGSARPHAPVLLAACAPRGRHRSLTAIGRGRWPSRGGRAPVGPPLRGPRGIGDKRNLSSRPS